MGFSPDPERILLDDPDAIIAVNDLASNLGPIGYASVARVAYYGDRAQMRKSIGLVPVANQIRIYW
jgi:hypothetical protein